MPVGVERVVRVAFDRGQAGLRSRELPMEDRGVGRQMRDVRVRGVQSTLIVVLKLFARTVLNRDIAAISIEYRQSEVDREAGRVDIGRIALTVEADGQRGK